MSGVDWQALDRELLFWRRAGLDLPIWWRDDDAVAPTAALDRLLGLSQSLGMPLHLAVIPKTATDALVARLEGCADVYVMAHGWAHENHAPADVKKAEFGAHRPCGAMLAQVTEGAAQLSQMFGTRVLPIFVPPWNRISPELVAELPKAGFSAVSTYTPRRARLAADGVVQLNTHFDPIHWRGSGGLAPVDALLEQLVTQLADRRLGNADGSEPYGVLTHHLVHDRAIWDFTRDVLARLLDGGARPADMAAVARVE